MKKISIFYNRIGFYTLLKREIRRFMKITIQTLVAPLLSNVLYLAIFGGMLKTRQAGMEGVNYLVFMVPGLATMGAIFSAFQNPSFSIISQKYENTVQDLNSYPISNMEKSLAFILGGAIRGFLVGIMTYVGTAIFIGFQIVFPISFFLMLWVTSFIFASLGLIFGLKFNNFEKINFALSIVITPLAYLGGVFFEVTQLPGILSASRFINPVYPLVNITRYAYLGYNEGNLLFSALAAAILLAGLFIFAIRTFNKGVGVKTI